ncbi:MAG: MFS transporter [Coriobacteriales bacterium]|nr:MFS transporter [Coriobacteriales bacterium]
MANGSTEKLSLKLQFGIYMLGFSMFGAAAVSPAMGALQAAYPDTPLFIVTMLQTLPSLTVIVGALLAGAIVGKKIKYRTIAVIAMIIYGGFGVISTWVHPSIEVVLVWRALSGFGNGLLFPLGSAVVLRFVQSKDARATYLGRAQAIGSGGGVVLTLLGGFLAAISWDFTFLAYIMVFVALVLMLVCMTEPPTLDEVIARNPEAASEGGNAKRVKLPALCWAFLALFMCYQLFQSLPLMTMPVIMGGVPGGDNPGLVGIIFMFFSGASFLIAGFVDRFVKIFGKFTASVFWIVGAIGILLIAFGQSVVMFGVGMFILGLAIGIMVMTQFELAQITTPAAMAWVASLTMVGTNLGNFLSSYWLGILQAIMGVDNLRGIVAVGAVGFVLCAVIWAVINIGNKAWKKKED